LIAALAFLMKKRKTNQCTSFSAWFQPEFLELRESPDSPVAIYVQQAPRVRFHTTDQVGRDKAGEGTGKEEIQIRQPNSILAALQSTLGTDFQSEQGLGLV
jgi:hypothetical protein